MSEKQRQSEIYLEHVLMVHAVAKRSGVGFVTAMLQALVPWLKAQTLTESESRSIATKLIRGREHELEELKELVRKVRRSA